MAINLFALLSAALWFYAFYLTLTRTKSPTAKGVALASLLLLAGIFTKDLVASSKTGSYPFEVQESHELGAADAVETHLINAEIKVAPGPAELLFRWGDSEAPTLQISATNGKILLIP